MDISKAFEHFQAGNLKLAGDICREILQAQPQNINALYLSGLIFQQTGTVLKSKGQLDEAIRFYDNAIACYQTALQIDQNFVEASDFLLFSYKVKNEWELSLNKKFIHCIGDSNVCFFSGKDSIHPLFPLHIGENPPFKTYRLGPSLAYNLCRLNTTTKGREILFLLLGLLSQKSDLLLVYGEIDCRSHIGKQAVIQNRPEKELVEECVGRYFRVVLEIRGMGFNVGVWGVHPSSDSDSSPENPFPTYGTCEQRNVIIKLFNDYLHNLCAINNIVFISIFEELLDANLRPKLEYYFDNIHLSQKAFPLALSKIQSAYAIT